MVKKILALFSVLFLITLIGCDDNKSGSQCDFEEVRENAAMS